MVWIDPDNFLSIGHFTEDQRIDLAKMIYRLIRVNLIRIPGADWKDVAQTCFLGVFEAYCTYGQQLTTAHCTNYARSKIRDTFFAKTKVEDALSRHRLHQDLRACETRNIERDHEKELFDNALYEIQKILSAVEYEIYLDKNLHGKTVDQIFRAREVEGSIKSFYRRVAQIEKRAQSAATAVA